MIAMMMMTVLMMMVMMMKMIPEDCEVVETAGAATVTAGTPQHAMSQ